MSDVKQAMLDEIYFAAADDNAHDLYASGLELAIIIINKHLECMAIVPVEPDSVMIGAGEFWNNDDDHDVEVIYTAMLESFKAQL